MGVISGKSGKVVADSAVVHDVRRWSITKKGSPARYATSRTKGHRAAKRGNRDWSGQFMAYGHTPAVMPGDAFTFHGSLDGVNGCYGDALCTEVEIAWDQEGGKLIEYTCKFEAAGALTEGAEVGATDDGTPDPTTSIDCIVKLTTTGAVPATTTLSDVRTVRLTLRTPAVAYNSSTTGAQTGRRLGNFEASVSISVYHDDFTDLPATDTITELKIYVDSTTYWHLKWVLWSDSGNTDVDIEGAALVGAQLNGVFTGYAAIGAGPTATEGFLKNPATTAVWP